MARQITQLKVAVLASQDISEEKMLIREVVADFNQMYGDINHVEIKISEVSSADILSATESELLSEEYDAVIALFWGTYKTQLPLSARDLGDLMDILLEQGKLFVFFSDCHMESERIEPDAYKMVLAYRERYGPKKSYNQISEFKRMLTNQLSLYFLNLLKDVPYLLQENKSKLIVMGVDEGELVKSPKLFRTKFLYSKYITNIKQKIPKIFTEIETIEIPVSQVGEISPEPEKSGKPEGLFKFTDTLKSLQKSSGMISEQAVELQPEMKQIITEYAKLIEFEMDDRTFYHLGGLKRRIQPFTETGQVQQLIGTEDEKNKYNLIIELYTQIRAYEQFRLYFNRIDTLQFLTLAIGNVGSAYDEDIDVKLVMEKGEMFQIKDMPLPGEYILEVINGVLDTFFVPNETADLERYSNYSEIQMEENLDYLSTSSKQKYMGSKKAYLERINRYFCYNIYEENGKNILKFKVKYIKQGTYILFPTHLMFTKRPLEIQYEIKAKHTPMMIHGVVKIAETSSSI